MAADESRAKRIRDLYDAHPDVTWVRIEGAMGVSGRSVATWAATGAISYANAKKLAQFFRELGHDIDDDYIWRGDPEATPNLLGMFGSDSPQSSVIEALLREVLSRLDALEQPEGRLDQLENQIRLLRAERAADAAEALQRNEEVLHAIRHSRPGQP